MLHTNEKPMTLATITETTKKAHIYYCFYDKTTYIKHAVDFLRKGIESGHALIFAEDKATYQLVCKELSKMNIDKEVIESITFLDNETVYNFKGKFMADQSINIYKEAMQPLIDDCKIIRLWGNVAVSNTDGLVKELKRYELACDQLVDDQQVYTVCAYNGFTTHSYIQNEMLKMHEYFMTDEYITHSPCYNKQYLTVESVSEVDRLAKLESENLCLSKKNLQLSTENRLLHIKKNMISESEKFYRTLINEIPMAILISKRNNLVFINDTAKEIFELNSKLDLIGRNIFDFILEKDQKETSHIAEEVVQGKTTEIVEQGILLENGQTKFFNIKSFPTMFEGETAALHILTDLTEKKLTEKIMIRSEKLNMAGQLAAGIAHEIRNPLTAVKGFFKMIQNNTMKDTYFTIIQDELNKIEQISGELLILAKPHSEHMLQHNLSTLVDNVKILLEAQANMKGIEIVTNYDQQEITLNCDATKIKQVFINIIKNAIEAMNNGKIYIETKLTNTNVVIKIQDEGTGIPEAVIENIGVPFFTTKDGGTGLGLHVCHKIIDSYGGTMEIESKEGLGTKFIISLPI